MITTMFGESDCADILAPAKIITRQMNDENILFMLFTYVASNRSSYQFRHRVRTMRFGIRAGKFYKHCNQARVFSDSKGDMKTAKFILCSYFILGGVITLLQLGLVKVFDADSSAERMVWARYPKHSVTDGLRATRTGNPPPPHAIEYAFAFGRWLPDHVAYFHSKDASLKGYVFGGKRPVRNLPISASRLSIEFP